MCTEICKDKVWKQHSHSSKQIVNAKVARSAQVTHETVLHYIITEDTDAAVVWLNHNDKTYHLTRDSLGDTPEYLIASLHVYTYI